MINLAFHHFETRLCRSGYIKRSSSLHYVTVIKREKKRREQNRSQISHRTSFHLGIEAFRSEKDVEDTHWKNIRNDVWDIMVQLDLSHSLR